MQCIKYFKSIFFSRSWRRVTRILWSFVLKIDTIIFNQNNSLNFYVTCVRKFYFFKNPIAFTGFIYLLVF